MIDPAHILPVTRQSDLSGLSRSRVYYCNRPVSAEDSAIMRRMDELHLEHPFAGSRMLRDLLRGEGISIGREPVGTLMKRLRIEAIYRRPQTSNAADGHKIYPYLLRHRPIMRPNDVWATDMTYGPMTRGFVYLVAVMDWFTRKVLSWRLSITMEVDFCMEAVEDALALYPHPEIFNSDQGAQFTGSTFTGLLLPHNIAISMDEKGGMA